MYPFSDPLWNVIDQRYWFKMCRLYRYPVSRVREPYRYLIETNQDATWEADYLEYIGLANAAPPPPDEAPTE